MTNWPKLKMVPKNSELSDEDNIVISIERIFAKQWNEMGNPLPVYYRNRPMSVSTKQECIALTVCKSSKFVTNTETKDTIERQLGIVLFQIFTPMDTGLTRANKIAELISPVFGTNPFTVNGLKILFRPLEIFPVGERKNYFQLNARVPFVADSATEAF